jgi:hypothetical protein
VNGGSSGIFASGPTSTSIINSGFITDKELFAIHTVGASTTIDNSGTVLGFMQLTDSNDTFTNRPGGVFEARLTSDFAGGNDLFVNQEGGTVHTAANRAANETTAFVGLERFENQGCRAL